jgi:hypothetical protein
MGREFLHINQKTCKMQKITLLSFSDTFMYTESIERNLFHVRILPPYIYQLCAQIYIHM